MLLHFSAYLRDDRVKRKSKDRGEAAGLLKNGQEDFEKVRAYPLSADTASFVLKNAYDALRAALQAFLSREGFASFSHEAIISFNLELGTITPAEANLADKFRQLRNDIAYRAARATEAEARELLDLGARLLPRLAQKL